MLAINDLLFSAFQAVHELVTDVVIEQRIVTFVIQRTRCTFRTKSSNDRRNDNNRANYHYPVDGQLVPQSIVLTYRLQRTVQ